MQKKHAFLLGLLLVMIAIPTATAATYDLVSSSYSPAPAEPGKLVTLMVTIQNTTNENSGPITITAKPEYPFSLSPSGKSELQIQSLSARQTQLAEIELQVDGTALNGTYSVEVQVKEGNKVVFGRPVSILVLAIKPQVEVVGSENNVAKPGETLETKLFIRNVGSSEAKNIFIGTTDDRTVTTTGVVVNRPIKNIGTSAYFVESLGPNESKEIPLLLGVDNTATQITHLVPIIIRFQDANRSDFQVTRYIGIRVHGDSILDASLTPRSTDQPTPGSKVNPSANLFNLGSGTAHGIVVEVVDNPIWKVKSEKKVFIGALDPDGFDSFDITATIASDAKPGNYPITLRFIYKDADYQSQTVDKTVQLQILSPAEVATAQSGFPWGTTLLVIVILVAAYFGYKRFFGKKSSGTKR